MKKITFIMVYWILKVDFKREKRCSREMVMVKCSIFEWTEIGKRGILLMDLEFCAFKILPKFNYRLMLWHCNKAVCQGFLKDGNNNGLHILDCILSDNELWRGSLWLDLVAQGRRYFLFHREATQFLQKVSGAIDQKAL